MIRDAISDICSILGEVLVVYCTMTAVCLFTAWATGLWS